MQSIQAMRARRRELIAEARQLANKKGFDPIEDQKKFDALLAEADAIEAQIVREQRLLDVEAERDFAARGRPIADGQDAGHGETWVDMTTGRPVPVLSRDQKLAALTPNTSGMTFGNWLRNTLIGWRDGGASEFRGDVSTSGISIPQPLVGEFIDRLREAMVLSRAGVRTVPMDSKTLTMVRIVGDPAVSWHAENSALTASDPAFDALILTSKTIVGITKFSLELAQDSANFEEAATRSLISSLARAIDQAGLFGSGSSNNPAGVMTYAGRQQVTSIGAPADYGFIIDGIGELLNANVELDRIGACIMHTRLWKDLAKLKTGISGDKTALAKPPAIENIPLMTTTSVPVASGNPSTTTAFIGDWSDLLFGIRQDIQIVPIREAFLGSNLQLALLVYARVDFKPAHEQSFCTLEGIALS